MAKLMDTARINVDAKTAKRIAVVKQNARAVETAEDRIAKIAAFAHAALAAEASATAREMTILSALMDLMSGRSYSPREAEILTRALRNVRREIAVQSAAD